MVSDKFLSVFSGPVNGFVTIGLIVVAGLIAANLIRRVRGMPGLSGYILVGLMLGPNVTGILSREMLERTQSIVDIALGLILYQLGVALDIKVAFRTRGLLVTSVCECTATFVLVSLAMLALGVGLPHALLIAAIAVSASPAVLMHVGREMRASGQVTDSTRILVALNNLASVSLFWAVLPLMERSVGETDTPTLIRPLFVVTGSICLGTLMAALKVWMARWIKHEAEYRIALMIGTVVLTLGLARMADLSSLYCLLVMGVAVRAFDHADIKLHSIALGPSTEVLYIIMFVTAGAAFHPKQNGIVLFAVPLLVLARTLAQWGVAYGVLRRCGTPADQASATGLLLLPLASMAIGLTRRTVVLFPDHAEPVPAIVLGAITLLEVIGPIAAAYAFRHCGEAGKAQTQPEAES